jgi:hypothetical protein
MDYLGLNSLDELPRLNEIVSEEVVPTDATEAIPENTNTQMVVSADGELLEIENHDSIDKNHTLQDK